MNIRDLKPNSYTIVSKLTNQQPEQPGYFERVGQGIKQELRQAKKDITETDNRSALSKGISAVSGVARAAMTPLAEVPGFKQLGEKIGKGIEFAGGKLADLYSPEFQQKLANMSDDEFQQYTQPLQDIKNLGDISNAILLAKGGQKGTQIAKIGAEAGIKTIGKGTEVGGRITSKAGEVLYKQAIPISKREAGILQNYRAKNPLLQRVNKILKGEEKQPKIAEQTALEKGFSSFTRGGIGVQAKREAMNLWKNKIEPALKASKNKTDMKQFFNDIEDRIVSETKELGRKSDLLEGLEAIKENYKNVREVSDYRLQGYKEGWAKFVPEKAYRGKPIAGVYNEVKNMLAQKAREKLAKSLGEKIRNDYLDYGNLKNLEELGLSSMTGEKLKGGFGSLVSDIYQQAITPVATIGGQAIYKTGKAIEKFGKGTNR